jgi:tetratricopeptide (TPR) repeat protein
VKSTHVIGCHLRNARTVVGIALLLAVSTEARAQQTLTQPVPVDEIKLLNMEAAKEAAGDIPAAQNILKTILVANPGSLSAIITLERLLRTQTQLAELIPYIERLLASDPTSPIGYQMLVRTYSNLNMLPELEQASEAWIKATPKLETPYREIARVWEQRRDYAHALQVLERGRSRIGRPEALALELGDAYVGLGDPAKAVAEWGRAIGPDARGFMLVQRRVAALPDGGARVLPPLINTLTHPPTSMPRQKAAVTLAIEAGLAPQAETIAKSIAAMLKGLERQNFLVEVARRADNVRISSLAYWAYGEVLAMGAPADQMLAIRSRLAELALTAGDTVRARESYSALEKAYAAGTPEHRQAVALRIELTARDGKLDDAMRSYEDFRKEAPDAPETDRAAAALAGAMLDRGDPADAEKLLTGVSGPRASLVRGRIALRQGDLPKALSALMAAAPSLQGDEATETIALITLVGRLSPAGGDVLGRALAKAWAGDRKAAVLLIENGSTTLPADEHSAILDYAAGLADRADLAPDAERIRRTIVTDYAQTLEAASALLALGRAISGRPEAQDEARQLFERLILDYPRSALVPQARHELDLLHSRVPSS